MAHFDPDSKIEHNILCPMPLVPRKPQVHLDSRKEIHLLFLAREVGQGHPVKKDEGCEILEASLENIICHMQEGHYWRSRTETQLFLCPDPCSFAEHADESIASFAWMKDLMLLKRNVKHKARSQIQPQLNILSITNAA